MLDIAALEPAGPIYYRLHEPQYVFIYVRPRPPLVRLADGAIARLYHGRLTTRRAWWAWYRALRRKRNFYRHQLHSRAALAYLALQSLLTLIHIVGGLDNL